MKITEALDFLEDALEEFGDLELVIFKEQDDGEVFIEMGMGFNVISAEEIGGPERSKYVAFTDPMAGDEGIFKEAKKKVVN